jgi:eukaryotic-like serine/threonine-protein kinase
MERGSTAPKLKFGPYLADLRAGELRKNGLKVRLQEKPLRVLALLAQRQGEVVTREELKSQLWPSDTFVDFETGLNTAVSKLRDALADDADQPHFIETIPRRGYRFLVPVEFAEANAALDAPAERAGDAPKPSAPVAVAPTIAPSAAPTLAPASTVTEPRALWRVLAWSGGVLAVLLALAYWLLQGRPALSFHTRDSVLVADFENQTGDPRFDNALATAFTVGIAQSRYANVFPRTRLDSVLKRMGQSADQRVTPAVGREICQRENIRGLILSSITRTGQEYALTAELVDPQSGETVRSYTERSYGEDHILDALDVLSRETREALGESLYQIHRSAKPLPQVTTRSLSALQQYADGQTLWKHAKYPEAVTLYKAALALDPDFAMAHEALGAAYYSHIFYHPNDGQKEYEAALSQTSRTTERERMMIQTRYAEDRNHVNEAAALFNVYLERYPDDSVMRYDYANLLWRNGRARESIPQYQQAARVAPDSANIYINLASAQRELGDYSESLQSYAKAFAIEPHYLTIDNINREYGFTFVANGEDQKAAQVFTDLLENPEHRKSGLQSLAFLDLYHGQNASAGRRLEQALTLLVANEVLNISRLHLDLSLVAEGQGDVHKQRQELDTAAAALKDIQEKVLYGAYLGEAYARAGLPEQAEKIDAVIRPLADTGNPMQMGYLHLAEGEIALSTGQNDKAIDLLTQADKERRNGFTVEALAHAYHQSGNLEKAIPAYEDLLQGPNRSLGWEAQPRWLEAHYTLASDYAAHGDKQKARETLAALLSLWKDADPDLPLLKRAKADYAKLQ